VPRELNVTSYAILGLLAMRDWTAYDLTKEMRRNLHYFWPRAESAIYIEAKRLRAAGLAEACVELHGRRRRTTYSITAQGRDALRAWLAEPAGRGALLESEGLLRVFLAGSMAPDPAAVLGAVDALERDAAEMIAKALLVGGEFLEGRAQFQDQLRWRAHTHDFFVRYALLLAEWAQQTRDAVAAWEGADEVQVQRASHALVAAARERLVAAPANVAAPTRDDQQSSGR
jgi:PadR family transcriptional regulator AphA